MSRNALQVRADLISTARIFSGISTEFSKGRKGAIVGALNRALGSSDNRHIALSWIFRAVPSTDFTTASMTKGEWYAVDHWIGSWRDDSGWHVRPDFYAEAVEVIRFAIREYAATKFGVRTDSVVAASASLPGLKIITEQEQDGEGDGKGQ